MVKYGLWKEGKSRLLRELNAVRDSFDSQILELHEEIDRHHKKLIKGKEYWYRAARGRWRYAGAVGSGDPVQEAESKINILRVKRDLKVAELQSCVLHELGQDLLIDLVVYKPPEEEVCEVKDIFLAVKEQHKPEEQEEEWSDEEFKEA